MWECLHCRIVFVDVDGTRDRIQELYDHYYDNACFVSPPPTVITSLEELIQFAERFRKNGNWLDIGYGEGAVLRLAESYGWACYGTEISPRALDYGRQQGWAVTSNPSTDPRFEAGAFDVVTMIEVLEHVPDPFGLLTDMASWLRPGGLLYITTPNIHSLNGRILGPSWSIVSPPEHLVLWTIPALRCALRRAGFNVLRIRCHGLNPSEMLARLRYTGDGAESVDRNKSAVALSEAFARTSMRRRVKSAINMCLSASRLGDTVKVWARLER